MAKKVQSDNQKSKGKKKGTKTKSKIEKKPVHPSES